MDSVYHLSNLESPPLSQEDVTDRDSDICEVNLSVTTWTVLESENTTRWFQFNRIHSTYL